MSSTTTSAIEQARSLIQQAQQSLNAALSFLKQESLVNGRVNGDKLDRKQLACYEVAYCEAEITAAKVMLDYSQKVKAEKGGSDLRIEERLALQYAAEALQNCRGRFNTRRADFGFSREQLRASLDSDVVDAFINQYLSTESLEAVGQAVLHNDGFTGEYMLDHEKEMMRDQVGSPGTELEFAL